MPLPSLIVLAGFMGTGKTAVGQALARTIGYVFSDSDREIEAREARSIPQIFESEGEAYFRRFEKEVIERLSQNPRTVLSVGGGAILDPETFKLLDQKGTIILLTASIKEITKRLGHGNERPLLKGGGRKKKVEQLLAERAHVYSQIKLQVDTTGLAIDEVVQGILNKLS